MNDRRKSNHLKLVTGSHRVTPAASAIPASQLVAPEPPQHLSPKALEAWRRIVPMLMERGTITLADGIALERLCELYAEKVELEADIRANGAFQTVTTVQGGSFERCRPQARMLSDVDKRLRLMLAEFGLTPGTRAKVATNPKLDKGDEFFGDAG